MGKNRTENTLENYQKKLLEGRGTGDGIDYLTWLTGHEFASQGAYVRLMGFTIPRMYVFLSHLESDVFRIYDHMEGVKDIKEQFPLPLMETLSIADWLGIKHPYSGSYFNVVTTDLLILKDGNWIGRAVKSSRDLEKKRVVEKLRIEQEWFRRMGLDWKIVTEKQINRELVKNIRWLYEDGEEITHFIKDPYELERCERAFCDLYLCENMPFPDILEIVEAAFFLEKGGSMAIFKNLVKAKKLPFDMELQFNPKDPRRPLTRRGERYGRYSSYS